MVILDADQNETDGSSLMPVLNPDEQSYDEVEKSLIINIDEHGHVQDSRVVTMRITTRPQFATPYIRVGLEVSVASLSTPSAPAAGSNGTDTSTTEEPDAAALIPCICNKLFDGEEALKKHMR